MTLEDTLADLRERVTMLRVEGHPVQAASVERAIEQLVACLPEYLVLLSEQEAVTYNLFTKQPADPSVSAVLARTYAAIRRRRPCRPPPKPLRNLQASCKQVTAPAKAPRPPFKTALPPLFRAALKAAGLPLPVAELVFHPTRKWRFDYAWDAPVCDKCNKWQPIALEVQGGLFVNGRHSRGAALLKEHEKLSEAAALGWRVLFTTPQRLCHPDTLDLIRRALDA